MALAATATGWSRIPAFLPVFAILAGAVGLSGCNQSTASSRSSAVQPALATAPPATGEPVALSGATYTQADIAANPRPAGPSQADIVKPSGPTNQAVASTPLPGSTALVMPAPKPAPVVAAPSPSTEPLPGLAAAPRPVAAIEPPPGLAAAPAAPMPTQASPAPAPVTPSMPTISATGEVSGAAVDAKGFPNINVPPREPTAQLLSPEERAKLIAELNALAGRPTQ